MNLAEFHFIRPYWLLALLPAVALIVLSLQNRLGRGNWEEVCDAALLPYILQDKTGQQSRWPLTSAALAILLSVLALAGPTWERLPSPVFRNAAALVIALNLSPTMDASDIKPSRLGRARFKIADILRQRKDGQTALLVYAGDAFTVTPLTEDNKTIASQLNALKTDIMPSQGSNTLAAIKKAVQLSKQAGLQHGHILLITDSVEQQAIEQVPELLGPYRLSVLGVGTTEGAPVKLPEGGFLKDAKGSIVLPRLKPAQLSELAAAGKGLYQTLSSNDSDTDAILKALDKPDVENTNAGTLYLDRWDDKGPWLLLLVLPLAALSFRKGLLGLTLLVLLPFPQDSFALEWRDLWQNKNQQAHQKYANQQYDHAAELFQSPAWKAAAQYKAGQYQQAAETLKALDNADSHYNRGNALARAGQLQQALQAYQQVLKIDPDNEDAKFNKELVEKALQQQQKNQAQQGDNKQHSQSDSDKLDNKDKQGSQDKQGDQSQSGQQQQQDQQQHGEQAQTEPRADQDEQPEQAHGDESKPYSQDEADKQGQDARQNRQSDDEPSAESKQTAQAMQQHEMDESKQASEQWLKRIPDDPSGLLKRKFKYQYGQRNRQP